jgi:scyllo-inositol 2-dehydrogenase (NADP+)
MTTSPIVTALLSYGMSGEVFHAPLVEAHPGFTLAAVVQRKNTHARDRYPKVKIMNAIDEVLADKTIELLVINTPNETHFDFASRALEAGKHIVVEKPFTVTTAEASALIALANKKNKILSVFQNRRWDGDFLTVQHVVEKKLVGKIVEFEAHYDRYRNVVDSNTWKEEAKPGVGILYNLGSHMLDQVLVLFGMPTEVDARLGIQRPGGKVEDFYDIRLHYDGFQVIVKSSYLVREPGPRYILHGVDGSFVKYGLDPQEQNLKEAKIPGSPGWGQESKEFWGKINSSIHGLHVEGTIETLPGNYLSFYQNVYEAIREGKSLAVKHQESVQLIQLIEACQESNKRHQAVKI